MNHRHKITVNISKSHSSEVREVLEGLGIPRYLHSSGRVAVLSGGRALWGGAGIYESPMDSFEFYRHPDRPDILPHLVERLSLDTPGRGSLFLEEVKVLGNLESFKPFQEIEKPQAGTPIPLFGDLMMISCIVQRGRGNDVAKAALHTVAGVPWVTYGTGAGLRERLGLIRITIPADKEIVNLVVSREEAPSVVEELIRESRLNQPGQGFIYSVPILRGLINTRLSLDAGRHLASMEQVIQAIDLLKGSPAWRRRSVTDPRRKAEPAGQTREEVDITFFTPQGRAPELVEAARKAGANGATMRKVRQGLTQSDGSPLPPLDAAHLVVRKDQENTVLEALDQGGLTKGEYPGWCEIKPVHHSFTYRPRS